MAEENKDCVFCKIVSGVLPSQKIYEDDELLAFRDAAPQAPVHFLVVPKKHIPSIMALEDSALAASLLLKAAALAEQEGCAKDGARFVINHGKNGAQTVPHLHVHVLGGRALGWPPG